MTVRDQAPPKIFWPLPGGQPCLRTGAYSRRFNYQDVGSDHIEFSQGFLPAGSIAGLLQSDSRPAEGTIRHDGKLQIAALLALDGQGGAVDGIVNGFTVPQ